MENIHYLNYYSRGNMIEEIIIIWLYGIPVFFFGIYFLFRISGHEFRYKWMKNIIYASIMWPATMSFSTLLGLIDFRDTVMKE